jgi:hypothetical protein
MVERCSGPGRRGVARRACRRESSGDMVRICRGLISRLVATVAIDWQSGEVVIHMAARAWNRCGVKASEWESRCIVIERRGLPR